MSEDEARAHLETGESLLHFAPGKALPLSARLPLFANSALLLGLLLLLIASIALVKITPWLGLAALLYFPGIYFLLFRSGDAKTSYAVTNRRLLILRPDTAPISVERSAIQEISTDAFGAVRVESGEKRERLLTPADAPALEKALLELASVRRTASLPGAGEALDLDDALLDGEQILWSGKVQGLHLTRSRWRFLLLGLYLTLWIVRWAQQGFSFFDTLVTVLMGYVFSPSSEGQYVLTNRRLWWVCGARRFSAPLTRSPEVFRAPNGVGTLKFGKRRWEGIPEVEKVASIIEQVLSSPEPGLPSIHTAEEPERWWLSGRRGV